MKELSRVSADHDKLTVLGQRRFHGFVAYQVVTFLNQLLKDHGIIFGLRETGGEVELTVYSTEDHAP